MKAIVVTMLALALTLTAKAAQVPQIQLTTANTINFRGEVSMESITTAMLKLTELNKQRGRAKYPLYLVMDSPGGSIFAGDAFIQFVRTIPNVHTISLFAASMASAIVQANPGNRYVTRNAVMMFHRAKGGFEGQFEEGEVEQQLKLWKSIVLNMENTNADRIKIPLADYKAKVKDEWWMYGKEAVEQKTADVVVDVVCTPELIEKREIMLLMSMFGSAKAVFSACPLFRDIIVE